MYQAEDISIAIPTFGRDDVLVDTIRYCLDQAQPPGQVIVIDQTPVHEPEAERQLREWAGTGRILWERLSIASQPGAMNHALRVATRPLVLFLDDDIIPAEGFVAAHARAHEVPKRIVVGQIIQPWQTPGDYPAPPAPDALRADLEFPFHSNRRATIRNVMSGHMSLSRQWAIELGGFDENFHGAAYRFDTEFGRRAIAAGGEILFEPAASIKHLRAQRGGTRVQGDHLASASPNHGVGDYYFALLNGWRYDVVRYVSKRLVREVCTKFHLKHPWYIPVKMTGEMRALFWAFRLKRRGPKRLTIPSVPSSVAQGKSGAPHE